MIDFYTWATPNGRKIAIMLEETRLDYEIHRINIDAGEQFGEAFRRISPNSKIPAIVDRNADGGPLAVFESGAILTYLAERSGQFLPATPRGRSEVLQWLFWQVSGMGPTLGQFHWFNRRKGPEYDAGRTRFTEEAARLFAVLDGRLGEAEFLADAYSIADMAAYPWSIYQRRHVEAASGASYSHVARWEAAMALRPAVGRGMAVPVVG